MAAKVEIKVLQKNLDLLLDHVTETDLLRRAQNVVREIQATAPRSDGTNSFTDGIAGRAQGGRLAESFRVGFTTDHGKKVIRIFSDARNSRGQNYAGFVIKGSGAHVIAARNTQNLAFQWINRGVFVITPQVRHPGTAPNNFVLRALLTAFDR